MVNKDNHVDGNSAAGNEDDDDGDGATGNDKITTRMTMTMTMTEMAMARWAAARWDTMTTTVATGSKVEDDGDNATGDYNDDNNDGDDYDKCGSISAMGSGRT